jgi:transglutaminase-like putative cysteine protease
MRFQAIHKLASYLMALCAYGAVVLSEELSPFVVIGAAIGMVVSWFWEPPRVRPERWTAWWNALALAAFGYTVLQAFAGASWITGGTQLLLFLLVAKLFNRRTSRDYQWVYVVSFLLLVAGTTLNNELSYAVCFLGYVIFATWALILFHLRREMEDNFLLKHSDDSSSERVEVERILNSRRIVGGKFLLGTSTVSLVIFIASALLFFLFPRVGFGLFFHKRGRGVTLVGLSDRVQLGGHGRILDDDTVVMRVKITDSRWVGSKAPELHWRAVSFDRYVKGQWSNSRAAFPTEIEESRAGGKVTLLLPPELGDPPRAGNEWRSDLTRQEIYLEPIETSALPGASRPVGFELEGAPPGMFTSSRIHRNGEVRLFRPAGLKYVAWSDVRPPDARALRAAADADPVKFEPYLRPREIPPRIRDKAIELTRDARTPWEKVLAIEAWLARDFSYTLELDDGGAAEPLEHFLFERKKGHCEYFSTAEAVMLRAVGVPTRNVNGFLGGEWNEYGDYIAVRAGDAHSWLEVWIEGVGWVTRDPTPAAPEPLGRGGGGVFDKMRRMLDTLRLKWFEWVIEYDLGRQMGLMKSIGDALGLKGGLSFKSIKRWAGEHKGPIGVVLLAIAALIGRRIWRKRRRTGDDAPPIRRAKPPSHPVVQVWIRAAKRLAKNGWPRSAAQTPREHASALVKARAPGAQSWSDLTELYYLVRFSESDEIARSVDVEQARRLAAEVEQALRARDRGHALPS